MKRRDFSLSVGSALAATTMGLPLAARAKGGAGKPGAKPGAKGSAKSRKSRR